MTALGPSFKYPFTAIICEKTVRNVYFQVSKKPQKSYNCGMANEGNLRPFKNGADPRRNLKGRPVGATTFGTLLRKEMMKEIKTNGGKMPAYEVIINRMMEKALKGDVKALKMILNITDGPVKTDVEIRREKREDSETTERISKKDAEWIEKVLGDQ